jgi:hypothetical protein
MRKFMVVPLAGLLVLGAATPAFAGANVGNSSGSATVAQGGWDSYDDATQTSRSGYVAVVHETGSAQTYAEYQQYTDQSVQCTGAATPNDPTDDTFASTDTFVYGYGDAKLAIGKTNGSATASGTLSMSSDTFDGCTGEETYVDLPALAFTLNLTATSGTIRESGRGSFHIPGEFNGHSSYKSVYRLADGTFAGGATTQSVSGQIGTFSWTDHSNG